MTAPATATGSRSTKKHIPLKVMYPEAEVPVIALSAGRVAQLVLRLTDPDRP